MKILLTNDDGFEAIGIQTLNKHLLAAGHEVTIVAPDREKSASSRSITLFQPLRVIQKSENIYAVNGTPVDCSILGLEIIVKNDVDLVISGINDGPNMGEDVYYSGTVSAALEAQHLGFKAIAISMGDFASDHFDSASKYFAELLDNNLLNLIDSDEILNINMPDCSYEIIQGIKATRLGHRKFSDFVVEQFDPRGQKFYWIGGPKPTWDKDEMSDAYAVKNNFVSITPIKPDHTKRKSIIKIENWIENL